MSSSPSDSLATLTTAASEIEAHLVANVLREHGIEAAITGSFTSQFRAEAPGVVRILVKTQDLSVAESILAALAPAHGTMESADAEDSAESEQPDSSAWRRTIACLIWGWLAWNLVVLIGYLVNWIAIDSLSGPVGNLVLDAALLVATILAMALAWRYTGRRRRDETEPRQLP